MNGQKEELRKHYREIRDEISAGSRAIKSVAIWKHFFDTPEYKNAKTIMVYSDIKSEVRTNLFAERLFADGKRTVFPVCDKENNNLIPYEIDNSSRLKMGTFGVLEPSTDFLPEGSVKKVEKNEIDIVVVPGVAFDISGYRIGYGKGYYDQFLKDYKGIKIGFSYTDCICYSVFPTEKDIPMDMLITEAGCERFE
ncbi:MAG: 5-formyltetrahydrofolate cyclo-ligase [Clostridia bacterium]|nr:5-formyltetrahydrofolate cyclo-ligase [Clostridia bacterium]